jgi:hypothetical protein
MGEFGDELLAIEWERTTSPGVGNSESNLPASSLNGAIGIQRVSSIPINSMKKRDQ